MQVLIWALYFVTDVYGHVALKQASSEPGLWNVLLSGWGFTAVISWLVSTMTWTLLLSRHSLFTANAVSAFGYVLISAAAWAVYRDTVTLPNVVGVALICIGIYLVGQ